jgi:hypothetical protein
MVKQVPTQERELGFGGLLVAAQEGSVVPEGHPSRSMSLRMTSRRPQT